MKARTKLIKFCTLRQWDMVHRALFLYLTVSKDVDNKFLKEIGLDGNATLNDYYDFVD